MFSYALCLWELLTGEIPFAHLKPGDLFFIFWFLFGIPFLYRRVSTNLNFVSELFSLGQDLRIKENK